MTANPLQQGALTILSDIAAKQGNKPLSERLLHLAAARSARDMPSQIRLINLLISQRAYGQAIESSANLLKCQPDLNDKILDLLALIAADPRSHSALISHLMKHPSWRALFFAAVASRSNAVQISLRLLANLAESGEPLDSSDVAPVLNLLFNNGHREQAYFIWIRLLPVEKRRKAGFLFDGGFTQEGSSVPFEWMLKSSNGASVDLVDKAGVGGQRSLRVEFVGARVPYLYVSQLLYLAPGKYHLAAGAMAEELRASLGLVWRVSCWTGQPDILGETEEIRGSRPWHEIGIDFVVPTNACDFQLLQLTFGAHAPSEQTVLGTALFQNLRLERAE